MLRAAFALLVLLASATATFAAEEILQYRSEVKVETSGAYLVTETIRVNVQGIEITRGIYRDLPTRYKSPGGGSVKVGFNLLGAELDGRDVPTKLERMSNGVRIRIGDPDTLVSHGSHTYRIRYTVRRAAGFFKDHDELYWNVTGVGWGFPIDRASATPICRDSR